MLRCGVFVALGVLTSAITLASPALAATPPAKTCAAGENITRGAFSTLVVNGTPCSVSQVRVESGGTFVVNPGSSLITNSSTFASTIDVTGGSLALTGSTVRTIPTDPGGVTPTTSGAVQIARSAIYGDIADDNDGTWGQAGSFVLQDSIVTSGGAASHGSVRMEGLSAAPRAIIGSSRIDGFLAIRASAVTVDYTHIGGSTTFEYPASLEMCSVHILGDLRIEHAGASGAILGAYRQAARACAGGMSVRVDGNALLTDNLGPLNLVHLSVGGDLRCSGNATRPILGDVTVRGERLGQCA